MRPIEKKEYKKKKFILTPEVLIYHTPNQRERLIQILLLYIERIYVDPNMGKQSDVTFFIKTTNKAYAIRCKSSLDRNVWIKSLIHFTNLAKERNII